MHGVGATPSTCLTHPLDWRELPCFDYLLSSLFGVKFWYYFSFCLLASTSVSYFLLSFNYRLLTCFYIWFSIKVCFVLQGGCRGTYIYIYICTYLLSNRYFPPRKRLSILVPYYLFHQSLFMYLFLFYFFLLFFFAEWKEQPEQSHSKVA